MTQCFSLVQVRFFLLHRQVYELNPSVVAYFGLADNKEKIIEVLDK